MIITRTPFRVSFCGGGSDLPAFYEKHGGCVLSTGIDKYMYLSVHPSFRKEDSHEQNSTHPVFMRGFEACQPLLSLQIYSNNQLQMI